MNKGIIKINIKEKSDNIEPYIIYNNKKLRKGYTTGSCAAAAAKSAVLALSGITLCSVQISTIEGDINIPVKEVKTEGNKSFCTIIKDSGDDPDITNGVAVCAEVSLNSSGIINVTGGVGIGIVTLAGLKVDIGKPAINPVPMSMIKSEVAKVLKEGVGADIIISVPDGERLAKKTFNPRLGIVGGISILGTSGIVTPMSEEAYKESLALCLNILAVKNCDKAIFIFGEYGKDYTCSIDVPKELCITTSNFVGYMLDYAVTQNFKNIIIIGHIGKLIKVAGGIFHTHSKMADCRLEIITAYAALLGADTDTIKDIYNCITTSAAIDIIDKKKLTKIYQMIVDNVKQKTQQRIHNEMDIEVILFGDNNRFLSQTKGAKALLEVIKKESNKNFCYT